MGNDSHHDKTPPEKGTTVSAPGMSRVEQLKLALHEPVGRHWRRLFQSLFLAFGAPAGWVIIVLLTDIGEHASTGYTLGVLLYMLIGSMAVFGVFSYMLGRSEQRFADLSIHDHLTGLYNTRLFHDSLNSQFSLAERHGHDLTLLLLDIDRFKRVNDTYGHPVGDRVLAAIAKQVTHVVRSGDMVARVGGEEFSVILPETDTNGGVELAERIRTTVESTALALKDGTQLAVTVSVGVAGTDSVKAETATELFAAVDAALYEAKNSGRNCVRVSDRVPFGDLHYV
ncbi:MAG: GGDEF domain-containing protein [Oceanidesulfovibrio sp.]